MFIIFSCEQLFIQEKTFLVQRYKLIRTSSLYAPISNSNWYRLIFYTIAINFALISVPHLRVILDQIKI